MRLDLVTCRNLLIYLERSLQQQLCALFHYGLKPGRFLFLGSAETADTAGLFAPLDREARIYAARHQVAETPPILPQFAVLDQVAGPGQSAPARSERADLPGALHVAALEQSAPPSALVDDGHSILHLSPTAGQFIQPSVGPLSNLLPAVVRPELRLDLRLALTRALEIKEPTLTHPVTIAMDGGRRRVGLHVIPVPSAAYIGSRALVLFMDGGAASNDEEFDIASDTRPDGVRHLHAELKASQEALVASRIGHETAIQDLRATNEELQSINEEYRSTAEELETSKEELQSINEELHTVNAELKSKLGSISIAHSNLQNLTSATEIGTLFLDPELRIRMFTPPIAELFNIAPTDIGRAITDFTSRLEYDGMEADVRRVVRDLAPVEAEVRRLYRMNPSWTQMRELLLLSFQVLTSRDVGRRPEPLDDVSAFVEQRYRARVGPADGSLQAKRCWSRNCSTARATCWPSCAMSPGAASGVPGAGRVRCAAGRTWPGTGLPVACARLLRAAGRRGGSRTACCWRRRIR